MANGANTRRNRHRMNHSSTDVTVRFPKIVKFRDSGGDRLFVRHRILIISMELTKSQLSIAEEFEKEINPRGEDVTVKLEEVWRKSEC